LLRKGLTAMRLGSTSDTDYFTEFGGFYETRRARRICRGVTFMVVVWMTEVSDKRRCWYAEPDAVLYGGNSI